MSDKLNAFIAKEVKSRGWSYRELARQAGVSHTLVSRTLSGDMPPSADFCIKVSEALEISPEYLLRLAEILPPELATSEDATLQELIEIAKNLSSEDRQDVLDYARFKFQQQNNKS